MVILINSPRLTDYGVYEYRPLTIDGARQMVTEGFQSAIGHTSTAAVLSELLGCRVETARETYLQRPGEHAIVFELLERLPEGHVIDRGEIERIGYRFGLLSRVA